MWSGRVPRVGVGEDDTERCWVRWWRGFYMWECLRVEAGMGGWNVEERVGVDVSDGWVVVLYGVRVELSGVAARSGWCGGGGQRLYAEVTRGWRG